MATDVFPSYSSLVITDDYLVPNDPTHQVDNLLAELGGPGPLRVNAVGLSRGGIACSYLAQVMADIPASRCWGAR